MSLLSLITPTDLLIVTAVITFLYVAFSFLSKSSTSGKQPPKVNSLIPYLGSFVSFGKHPVKFIKDNAKKYGDIFTAKILGKNMTFLTHPRLFESFFKAYDDELSLREVYRFMTPVFGKGVVYDAKSTEVMMEQIRFITSGMTLSRFRVFVDIFENEVEKKIQKQLKDEGTFEVFETLADLIIYTASRCLLGDEVRDFLDNRNMGKLYREIDEGINPLSFFFPSIPSGKRDHAVSNIRKIFQELITNRRQNEDEAAERADVLFTLMKAKYRSNEQVSDEHIIGILLAGLFAGQHTSSIASSWTLMLILKHKDIYSRVMQEQKEVMDGNLNSKLTFEKVKQMQLLEYCIREALRMYPPLIMLMRYVRKDRKCGDYTIPKGNVLVVSPASAGRHEDVYTNPEKFDPDRFSESRKEHEKFVHANLAFGSGRHKCIGENFALLQVKSILSCLLRGLDMELISELPTVSYTSLVVGPSPPNTVKYKKKISW